MLKHWVIPLALQWIPADLPKDDQLARILFARLLFGSTPVRLSPSPHRSFPSHVQAPVTTRSWYRWPSLTGLWKLLYKCQSTCILEHYVIPKLKLSAQPSQCSSGSHSGLPVNQILTILTPESTPLPGFLHDLKMFQTFVIIACIFSNLVQMYVSNTATKKAANCSQSAGKTATSVLAETAHLLCCPARLATSSMAALRPFHVCQERLALCSLAIAKLLCVPSRMPLLSTPLLFLGHRWWGENWCFQPTHRILGCLFSFRVQSKCPVFHILKVLKAFYTFSISTLA